MSRYTRARTSSGHRASLGWKRMGRGEEGRLTDSRMEEGRRMQQRSVHRLYTRLHTWNPCTGVPMVRPACAWLISLLPFDAPDLAPAYTTAARQAETFPRALNMYERPAPHSPLPHIENLSNNLLPSLMHDSFCSSLSQKTRLDGQNFNDRSWEWNWSCFDKLVEF